MTRENSGNVSRLFNLTDEEAVTLRRVGFGESDVRTLRRADLDRLLRLRLIEVVKDGMALTISGKEHLDSLPRNVFASPSRPRDHRPQTPVQQPQPRDRADRQWQMLSGARTKDPERR
jgi:hypothetical protein